MPHLDLRLTTVARQIRSDVHVDIGSDHGHLLLALLKSGRINRGIAVENKKLPFSNSLRALEEVDCDVRLGDGLDVLKEGEADSLSICGMGAASITEILKSHPNRIPNLIVLQPNRRSDLVRRWALKNKFRLINESIVLGHWPYDVMTFQRSSQATDPAYDGTDREVALTFGPLNLTRADPVLRNRLQEEREYLGRKHRLSPQSTSRLKLIERALAR